MRTMVRNGVKPFIHFAVELGDDSLLPILSHETNY
jgi:hypothetical protein